MQRDYLCLYQVERTGSHTVYRLSNWASVEQLKTAYRLIKAAHPNALVLT